MLILIIGPQGSGKTTIAKELMEEQVNTFKTRPLLFDNGEFSYEKPGDKLMHRLFIRDIIGADTIITIQKNVSKLWTPIPEWTKEFEQEIRLIITPLTRQA